jgi:NAD(P)-dependent dehydrogenase (short-subunit alcohol dehydrogenase family)
MKRVAIVTGGAGGLGSAMTRRFLADGLDVVVADLEATRNDLVPPNAMAVDLDVTQPQSAEAMVAAVNERYGRIDVLVNNAGIAGTSFPVIDYPVGDWHRVVEVNLFGVFHCTRACLPLLLESPAGRIVNIASVAGKDPNANMSAYSASKAGVIAFTKSIAKELALTNVLANSVVLAVMSAGLTVNTATEAEKEMFVSRVPMGRMGRPEELAELVSWLASDRCSFSTGAAFDLTGGRAVP